LGPVNTSASQLFCSSGKKDLLSLRRWEGRRFPVSDSFVVSATIQRCLVTWHLASLWLHVFCSQFCIIL